MVFHESDDVGVIVMLTQTIESGREKCGQYFPLDPENPSMPLWVDENDPFVSDEKHEKLDRNILGEVTLLETIFDEKSRSEIRKLELRLGSETKIVWHFLFAGWADYSKPEGEDREALLQLIELSGSKCSPDNPRVVHCSAGVGRTGTFIALDHLLKELESGQLLTVTDPEADPVFDTVDRMREQRMMMVFNEMQLQFIYEVLRESRPTLNSERPLDHLEVGVMRDPRRWRNCLTNPNLTMGNLSCSNPGVVLPAPTGVGLARPSRQMMNDLPIVLAWSLSITDATTSHAFDIITLMHVFVSCL